MKEPTPTRVALLLALYTFMAVFGLTVTFQALGLAFPTAMLLGAVLGLTGVLAPFWWKSRHLEDSRQEP